MTKVKFEDVATRVNTREDRLNTSLLYYVGGEHIESNEMLVQGCGLIKGSTIGPMFYCGFKKGDILLVSRNPHLRKASMVEFDGICSEKTFVLGTKDSKVLLQEFLALVMQSDDFWNYCEEHKSGGVNYFLNWSTLAKYEFYLPSIQEQKEIADKVWSAYRLKESYKKLLVATDEMVKSQFIEMFGGLCQDTPWSDVVTITNGKAYPEEYQEEGAYPICGSGGIMCYGEKKLCNGNTTILGRKGNINNPIFMESGYWIVDTAFSIDVDKAKLHPKFFYYWCCQYDFTKLNKQGVLPSLTRKDLEKVKMAIPQMRDQLKFVSIAEQADKSKFGDFKSQFIEMFENVESYCKLEDLVSDTFPGEWGSEPISENAIKVIRTTNFTNEGYLDLTDVVTRDIEPKKVVRKKLKQGDTILERSGGTKDNPVGRVVFFDEIGDYLPNNFTQVLRPKESVNPVYLFYALYNSYNLNKAAMRAMASQTTGIQNLSMSDFMAKFIVLPSRNEQNKFEQIYRQADKSKSVIQKALVYLNDIQSDELGKIA